MRFACSRISQRGRKKLPDQGNGGRTCGAPDLYADGAQRRTRERQHPFHVVWYPTGGKFEHRSLGVVELEEQLESVSADPSSAPYGQVEGRFVGIEDLICRFQRGKMLA